jgi:hypothetical protein
VSDPSISNNGDDDDAGDGGGGDEKEDDDVWVVLLRLFVFMFMLVHKVVRSADAHGWVLYFF